LTSLAVFPSVARAVTPSYTRAYHVARLWDPSITYLVLRSRNVSPAVSPVMSSDGCRHLSSGFRSLRRRDVRGRNGGKFENEKK
ncbi:unnamed protein product, partial [Staurois parvus]